MTEIVLYSPLDPRVCAVRLRRATMGRLIGAIVILVGGRPDFLGMVRQDRFLLQPPRASNRSVGTLRGTLAPDKGAGTILRADYVPEVQVLGLRPADLSSLLSSLERVAQFTNRDAASPAE